MVDIFSLVIAVLLAVGVVYLALAAMLPTIYSYARNYAAASRWLRRYFRHDMALYSPFDLVYLYLMTGRAGEVREMYRKYSRKGNIGSEYFVDAWVAAHQNEWHAAKEALGELRKYTIMNDVNLDKLATAIDHKSAKEVDEIYLIDMNGRLMVQPSFFRVAWVSIVCGAVVVLTCVTLLYFVFHDTIAIRFSS